jgi:hypothetical protein
MTQAERIQKDAQEADRALAEMQKQALSQDTLQSESPAVEPLTTTTAPALPDPTTTAVPIQTGMESEKVEKAEYDRLNAAYMTLQGKYNAEIPRLVQRLDTLESENRKLQETHSTPAQPSRADHLQYVKDEEIEDLAPEAMDLTARMARGVAQAEVNKIRQESKPLLESMQAELAQARTTALWNEVEKAYPGARTMNDTDASWIAFLGAKDELSGIPFNVIGNNALAKGDAETVKRLIARYKAVSGVNADTTVSASVLSQVKPATAHASQSTQAGSNKPTFKESEYEKFISDVTRGKFMKNPALQEQLSKQFESAALEGRIIRG